MPSPGHLDVPVIGASDDFDVVVAKLARYVSLTERLNTYSPAAMSWIQRIIQS